MKVLLLAVLFITIVLLILFYDRIRRMKIFRPSEEKRAERAARKAAKEEEYFRRTSQKNYHKEFKPEDLGKDYFKSTNDEQPKDDKDAKNTARRETTSSDGVTIIDERQSAETAAKEKKIFDDNEGEYVEFEEV